VEVEGNAGQWPRQFRLRLKPDGCDHAHPGVALAMLEVKRKRSGLDLNLPSSHESRLEPDAFLADIALRNVLRALADVADGLEVLLGEAVFVALHNKHVMIDAE
jgi:hypothetical protein